MTITEIETYLNTNNEILDSNVYEYVEKYRLQAIKNNNEASANYFWCLRQIYNVQKNFLSVYANLKIGKYENAWNQLERTDIELSFLESNFDKYTVIHPEGLEYNYKMLEILISNLSSPYEKWYIDETQVVKPEYRNIGRNTLCPCGSLKKFKKCCMNTNNIYSKHYRINFLFKSKNFFNKNHISFVGTWA